MWQLFTSSPGHIALLAFITRTTLASMIGKQDKNTLFTHWHLYDVHKSVFGTQSPYCCCWRLFRQSRINLESFCPLIGSLLISCLTASVLSSARCTRPESCRPGARWSPGKTTKLPTRKTRNSGRMTSGAGVEPMLMPNGWRKDGVAGSSWPGAGAWTSRLSCRRCCCCSSSCSTGECIWRCYQVRSRSSGWRGCSGWGSRTVVDTEEFGLAARVPWSLVAERPEYKRCLQEMTALESWSTSTTAPGFDRKGSSCPLCRPPPHLRTGSGWCTTRALRSTCWATRLRGNLLRGLGSEVCPGHRQASKRVVALLDRGSSTPSWSCRRQWCSSEAAPCDVQISASEEDPSSMAPQGRDSHRGSWSPKGELQKTRRQTWSCTFAGTGPQEPSTWRASSRHPSSCSNRSCERRGPDRSRRSWRCSPWPPERSLPLDLCGCTSSSEGTPCPCLSEIK